MGGVFGERLSTELLRCVRVGHAGIEHRDGNRRPRRRLNVPGALHPDHRQVPLIGVELIVGLELGPHAIGRLRVLDSGALAQDARDYLRWRLAAPGAGSPEAQAAPLSNWELNQRELASLPDTLLSRPILVYAEATSRCNLRCFMCRLQFPETTRQHRDHMKLETYARLEPLLEPGSRLSLFGLGEPLLNPSFVAMIRSAQKRGATVGLNSHAKLLAARIALATGAIEPAMLRISLRGGTGAR